MKTSKIVNTGSAFAALALMAVLLDSRVLAGPGPYSPPPPPKTKIAKGAMHASKPTAKPPTIHVVSHAGYEPHPYTSGQGSSTLYR